MAKSDPSLDNVISIPDGRTLGYAVYGVPFPRLSPLPEGPPLGIRTVRFCDSLPPPARHEDYASGIADVPTIIYCHGTPGSRLEASPLHKHALDIGARIISIDRPGIGLSSPLRRRTVLEFATDVKELLKQLQINKFHVLAYCAGAPYAFGLARVFARNQHQEGDVACRLLGVGIVAGLAPWSIIVENITLTERILANITYWCPSLVGYLLEKEIVRFARQSVGNLKKDSSGNIDGKTANCFDRLIQVYIDSLDSYSQKILQTEGAMQAFVANMREAYKGETASILQDIHLMISDWGFDLGDMQSHGRRHAAVGVPTCIKLWHGGRDANVRLSQSEAVQNALGNSGRAITASLTAFPYDTHFSILAERGGCILSGLVGLRGV